jgi:uncharacterized membrane protein YvbJ
MSFCPNCGADLEGHVYCGKCGHHAAAPQTINVVTPPPTGAEKVQAAGQAMQSCGCAITLLVFVIVPMCVVLYACATS